MTDLEKARQTIDSVDTQMAELFEKRMEAIKLIAAYKQMQGLPVEDLQREKEVIENKSLRLSDSALLPYYVDFLHSVMDISKKMQYELRGE